MACLILSSTHRIEKNPEQSQVLPNPMKIILFTTKEKQTNHNNIKNFIFLKFLLLPCQVSLLHSQLCTKVREENNDQSVHMFYTA